MNDCATLRWLGVVLLLSADLQQLGGSGWLGD
jgi:hypothetical protein